MDQRLSNVYQEPGVLGKAEHSSTRCSHSIFHIAIPMFYIIQHTKTEVCSRVKPYPAPGRCTNAQTFGTTTLLLLVYSVFICHGQSCAPVSFLASHGSFHRVHVLLDSTIVCVCRPNALMAADTEQYVHRIAMGDFSKTLSVMFAFTVSSADSKIKIRQSGLAVVDCLACY